MGLGSRSPIYDALLLIHVLCALGGFGANGLAGLYAGQLLPNPSEAAVKYFSSSRFLAEKLIYLVPVFGLILIGVSRGASELAKPWVIAGILLWLLAIGVAHSTVWPAERRVARAIAKGSGDDVVSLNARRISRGAMVLDLIFLAAVITMFVQFGGK